MTPNSDRDDSDLEGLDPYALMDVEANRLDGFFASVDDAGWRAPSRCEGWSVRDVLAHLTASEDYNRACLDGTVSTFLAGMGARGVTDLAVRERARYPRPRRRRHTCAARDLAHTASENRRRVPRS